MPIHQVWVLFGRIQKHARAPKGNYPFQTKKLSRVQLDGHLSYLQSNKSLLYNKPYRKKAEPTWKKLLAMTTSRF